MSGPAVEETPDQPENARLRSQRSHVDRDRNVRTPSRTILRAPSPLVSALAARRLAPARRWAVLSLVGLIVLASYVFFVSAGQGIPWHGYGNDYDQLAEGFRAGHLYLPYAPSPALLAKEDPYDPVNADLWARDISLYHGRYYLYWGPVPALLIAAVKVAFRMKASVAEQYPMMAFATTYFLCGLFLIERVTRRLFLGLPLALVAMAVLVFGLANPMLFLVSTAGVYMTAIMGGQAFLMAGLLCAFSGFWEAVSRGRLARGWLVAAGSFWVLAIGCRVSTGPLVVLLALLTAYLARPTRDGRWWEVGRNLVSIGIPIAIGVAALLAYNEARFGSWFEVGQRFQLSHPDLKFHFSLRYVVPDLYSYLLRPLWRSCHFPFVSATWDMGRTAFPKGFVLPAGYNMSEPVAGLLVTAPWAWLAPVGVLAGVRAWMRALRAPHGIARLDGVTRGHLLSATGFALAGSLTILPLLAIQATTMRYLADVTGGILLTASFGAWSLYLRARGRPWLRRALVGLLGAMCGATMLAGLLLGFTGYGNHFRTFNPALMERLDQRFSRCHASSRFDRYLAPDVK
jgi:hypothetical protein